VWKKNFADYQVLYFCNDVLKRYSGKRDILLLLSEAEVQQNGMPKKS
jgi:hypothetical protein